MTTGTTYQLMYCSDHPEMRFQELWATLTLRAEYQPLEQAPWYLPPVGSATIAREHITVYGYACTDYDVYRHHKPVSTAVTSICYQGQLKPNITRLEPLTATHAGVISLV